MAGRTRPNVETRFRAEIVRPPWFMDTSLIYYWAARQPGDLEWLQGWCYQRVLAYQPVGDQGRREVHHPGRATVGDKIQCLLALIWADLANA